MITITVNASTKAETDKAIRLMEKIGLVVTARPDDKNATLEGSVIEGITNKDGSMTFK